jgi:hypothetical protein
VRRILFALLALALLPSTTLGQDAIPDADGWVHACYKTHKDGGERQGRVRLVSDPSLCKAKETSIAWPADAAPALGAVHLFPQNFDLHVVEGVYPAFTTVGIWEVPAGAYEMHATVELRGSKGGFANPTNMPTALCRLAADGITEMDRSTFLTAAYGQVFGRTYMARMPLNGAVDSAEGFSVRVECAAFRPEGSVAELKVQGVRLMAREIGGVVRH